VLTCVMFASKKKVRRGWSPPLIGGEKAMVTIVLRFRWADKEIELRVSFSIF